MLHTNALRRPIATRAVHTFARGAAGRSTREMTSTRSATASRPRRSRCFVGFAPHKLDELGADLLAALLHVFPIDP